MKIYTDGSCLGNPGPGGWAAVLQHDDGTEAEMAGGYRLTTNNRMELLAVIEALDSLAQPADVDVYTDSQYVGNAIEKGWLKGWVKKGWKTASKSPVKNQDMWRRLIPLLERHSVRFHWLKGHAGHPENERCDDLARAKAQGRDLLTDEGYPG